MKKICVSLLGLLCLFLVGCHTLFQEISYGEGMYYPKLYPVLQDNKGEKGVLHTLNLWIPIRTRQWYVSKSVELFVPTGERIEYAVAKRLLEEEPNDGMLLPVGWKSLAVQEVYDSEGILYVVLNQTFFSPTEVEDKKGDQARALVCALTNTLVGLEKFSQVQIMVDTGGGNIQRPTRLQAGFPLEGGGDTALGARTFDETLLMTPDTSLEIAMASFMMKEPVLLESILFGQTKPSIETLENQMNALLYEITEYDLLSMEPLGDSSFLAKIALNIKNIGSENTAAKETEIRLVLEKDVWKVEYSSFARAVLL